MTPPESNRPPASDPFLCNIVTPPPEPPPPGHKSSPFRKIFAVLLSLCLGWFLVDAVFSFLDDSLTLFFNLHTISLLRGIISILATLMSVGIYFLIGLTPMIPKRLFLPIPLFYLVATLALYPFAIYCYDRMPQVVWAISGCQVILGLWLFFQAQNGIKFRWALVSTGNLGVRNFSWGNLIKFLLTNLFVLLPAVIVYLCVCSALAVDHFSEGFMALRPSGFTVQVRKYVRKDGKVIELFPMSHVADESFYEQVSQTFPTNSIILMEGVTDEHNLLTNKISYQRMARTLGLAEQHEKFKPSQGVMVRADVDVDQFSPETIDLLNLVMLIHAQGLNPENLEKLMQYSPTPQIEEQLFDDLLHKRNQHLLAEIQSHLSKTRNLMVPWGVAHMPEIAREIQKSGFQLDETQNYTVIRFFPAR
jgi:hypothetical protein